MLNNINKETKCVSIKNAKLKWVKMQNFRKIAKLRCRETDANLKIAKLTCRENFM